MADYTLWSRNRLHVWASWDEGGRLVIQGQDLQPGLFGATEYEYAVAVPASDVPALISALGVQTADDVMAYLQANGQSIVEGGERAWLEGLGITPEFWSRIEFDD